MAQEKIKVGRYNGLEGLGFTGWIEPEKSREWILFWGPGVRVYWAERDPDGAVVGDPVVNGAVPKEVLRHLEDSLLAGGDE